MLQKHNLLTILMLALASTLLIFTACEEDDEPTNSAPTCTITSPEDGAEFTQGETITIDVDAVDEDENLNEVRFYVNDVGIGSASSFPYNFDWDTGEEEPGSFTIKAEAIDEAQEKASDEISLTLNAAGSAPTASFTADQTAIPVGESVIFTDQSTNNPTSWSWDFGDGSTSTEASPSHTYSSAGTYTVELTVSNDYGSDTETKTDYITVSSSVEMIFTDTFIGDTTWSIDNIEFEFDVDWMSYDNDYLYFGGTFKTSFENFNHHVDSITMDVGNYCWNCFEIILYKSGEDSVFSETPSGQSIQTIVNPWSTNPDSLIMRTAEGSIKIETIYYEGASGQTAIHKNEKVSIFPNPVSKYLNFSFTGNSNSATFELFDTQGRKLVTKKINNNEQLNLDDLNSGLYLYNIHVDGNMQSGKLIKE